jgi:Tfp pilus assembly protein PilO
MKRGNADIAFALGMLAFALGVVQFVLRPTLAAVRSREEQLLATSTDIVRSEDFTRGLDDLARHLADFEAELEVLDRLVPRSSDADTRVREVAALAERCGVRTSSIRPDPPIPRGSVIAHPLAVKVVGDYPSIERLLFELESSPRHSRVTQFVVERVDPGGGDAKIKADIELTAYSIDVSSTGGTP